MSTPATVPDVSAGSSPAPSAPQPVSGQSVLESLSSDERSTWQQTGDLPDRVRITPRETADPSSPTTAASSPATPGEPVSDATPPASSAAPETPPQKRTGHKGNADTRIQELLEENARLRGQMDVLQKPAVPDAKAASSPATATQQDWKRIMAQPDAPKEADFSDYGEFTAAASYYVTQEVLKEHQTRATAASELRREVETIQSTATKAAERIAARQQRDPAFADKVDPRLLGLETASVRRLKGEPIGPQHLLAEHVMESEAVDALLEHFSTPEGQHEWRSLLSLDGQRLLVAFGRIESRFGNPAAAGVPAPKTTSTAPTPPTVLGTRAADTADPVDRAVKERDFARFARERNKQDLARLAG